MVELIGVLWGLQMSLSTKTSFSIQRPFSKAQHRPAPDNTGSFIIEAWAHQAAVLTANSKGLKIIMIWGRGTGEPGQEKIALSWPSAVQCGSVWHGRVR